jgi:phosphoglycerate dehydrogenase-like enzyme
MRILYYDVNRASPEDEAALGAEHVELDELLRESDFVSLHVNLTDETRGLLNAAAFEHMKPTAIVINTSRGPVIDHVALRDALETGRIGGAALDVTDPEPIPADDPLVSMPNCLIVPHIASASGRTRGRMAEIAARNLLAGLRGEPLPHPVNPDVRPHR